MLDVKKRKEINILYITLSSQSSRYSLFETRNQGLSILLKVSEIMSIEIKNESLIILGRREFWKRGFRVRSLTNETGHVGNRIKYVSKD